MPICLTELSSTILQTFILQAGMALAICSSNALNFYCNVMSVWIKLEISDDVRNRTHFVGCHAALCSLQSSNLRDGKKS